MPLNAMAVLLLAGLVLCAGEIEQQEPAEPQHGIASWYGEQHRGRPMANGQPFDPDKLTAASWFYPLGTRVRVCLLKEGEPRSVEVTITDRGPSKRLVAEGRIIDLGRAAFEHLAHPDEGLVRVSVQPIPASTPGQEAGNSL
jgi:rare lipoprotein A